MTEKLVAVAVAHDGTIAPHAGRALQWIVYVVADEVNARLAWTLNLTDIGCLHEWHVRGDGERHPLHFVDIAIAVSAGEGVRRRLQQRNTELLTTTETNPDQAVTAYWMGDLAAGLPHEHQACLHPSEVNV
ncbi:nitrogen fixation protein [Leptothoe sp. EHU-05/26/07-4]